MGRPRSPDKRTQRLVTSANAAEVTAFNAACKKVKMEPPDTLRKLADAFVEHVREHNHVVMPMRFAPPPKKSG